MTMPMQERKRIIRAWLRGAGTLSAVQCLCQRKSYASVHRETLIRSFAVRVSDNLKALRLWSLDGCAKQSPPSFVACFGTLWCPEHQRQKFRRPDSVSSAAYDRKMTTWCRQRRICPISCLSICTPSVLL